MKRAFVGAVVVVVVGACAKRIITPPPEAFVNLGGKRASYRNWKRVADLCAVDPKVFDGDVQSMNALLLGFLEQTSAGPEGVWADEHIALLEEGAKVLPISLELSHDSLAHAWSLGCPFPGVTQAKDLVEQAQRRIAEAPELLPVVRARVALAKWKEQRPVAQEAARSSCPVKPAKSPAVYFASEDEASRAEWLFCDGAKVVASPGNPPAYEAPAPAVDAPAPKKGKKPDPAAYVEAAAKYPAASISRAPKIPKKKRGRDDGAAEPKDAD